MTNLSYPIGRFKFETEISDEQRHQFIAEIEKAPEHLRTAVSGLSSEQLDTPYRPGGWTIRQVVHHLADSHLNAYTRFKLALTEEEPTIKPYDQAGWAELADGRTASHEISLSLLEWLHRRWVVLLNSMTPTDFSRTFRHPESGVLTLIQTLSLYAWHGRHHIAHISTLRQRMNW